MFKLIKDPQNDKVMQHLQELPNYITKAIREGAYNSGKELVADLRKSMKEGKTGRTYKIYRGLGGIALKKPRLHKASAPSETPAVITGEFRKSIDFLVKGSKTLEFGSGNEGLAKQYAKTLELGSSKMEARKPLGRTVDKLKNQVKSNIDKKIKQAIQNKWKQFKLLIN